MTLQIRYIVIILILAAFTSWSYAQEKPQEKQGTEKPSEKKVFALKKIPSSLEEILACALKSNPDIVVAEADLYHAQAKLKQARLKVSHALVEAFQQRKIRQLALEGAKKNYERMKLLSETGRLNDDDLNTHRQALSEAESSLTETEAMIAAVIGQDPISQKNPGSLEALLAIALQSNGEILLAKADLLRMDARSNQIRLQVTEEVTVAYQMRRVNKHALDTAKRMLQLTLNRIEQGIISSEEELPVFQAMIETEAELARTEARIRYLMG